MVTNTCNNVITALSRIFPSHNSCPSYELDPLVLAIANLRLGVEYRSVHREHHHVGGHLPLELLRLERHYHPVPGLGDELEGGESVRGRLQVADRPQVDVTEVGVRLEEHVGAMPLVRDVVVLELGRTPRQEVPLFLLGWQSFSAVSYTHLILSSI